MTNEESRIDFIEKHAPRALYHYIHAKEKHPYFCDSIACISETDADNRLKIHRSVLRALERIGDVEAFNVVQCELYEAVQANAHGDTAHAVEECFDAIAVLLRTIDVLEGRQKLGKPETKGETK